MGATERIEQRRGGLRHIQHRSFEDFSYGKQSLDGLLFPQRAFLFLGRFLPLGGPDGASRLRRVIRRSASRGPVGSSRSRRLIRRFASRRSRGLFPIAAAPPIGHMPAGCLMGDLFLSSFSLLFSLIFFYLRVPFRNCASWLFEIWLTGEIAQLVRAQDS